MLTDTMSLKKSISEGSAKVQLLIDGAQRTLNTDVFNIRIARNKIPQLKMAWMSYTNSQVKYVSGDIAETIREEVTNE